MSMVSYIADPEKREHLLQDAAARVSEVLFRIANSADLTGLSLEVDLGGAELAHAGEARDQGEVKKACYTKSYRPSCGNQTDPLSDASAA